jgi:hypothetical protein
LAKTCGRLRAHVVPSNKGRFCVSLCLVSLGCIEIHIGFRKSEARLIDLDPGRDTFTNVVAVAKETRKVIASTAFTMALFLQSRLFYRQRSSDTCGM